MMLMACFLASPAGFSLSEICSACEKECEKHFGMEHCRKCAEASRACAEACSHRVRLSVVRGYVNKNNIL